MTAILDPVTLADVDRLNTRTLHVDELDCIALLDELGHHLEAAASRAIVGATMAALVARDKRRGAE